MKLKIFILVLIAGGLLASILYLLFSKPAVAPEPVIAPVVFPVAESLNVPKNETVKTFDQLLSVSPRPVFQTVLGSIHLDVYGVLPCTKNPKESVIMLTGKYSKDAAINNFAAATDAVTAWEPYIIDDIGSLLFPNAKTIVSLMHNFEKIPVTNESVFPQYEMKSSAQVDGVDATVYYAWTLNYVFFATSQECLEDAMIAVYPAD